MKHGRVSDSNYSQVGPAGRWFESTPSDYHGRVAQFGRAGMRKRCHVSGTCSKPFCNGLENPVSMVRIHPLPFGFSVGAVFVGHLPHSYHTYMCHAWFIRQNTLSRRKRMAAWHIFVRGVEYAKKHDCHTVYGNCSHDISGANARSCPSAADTCGDCP